MADSLRDARLSAYLAVERELLDRGIFASAAEWHREAGVGTAIGHFRKGRTATLSDRTYAKLAEAAGITSACLRGEWTGPILSESRARVSDRLREMAMSPRDASVAAGCGPATLVKYLRGSELDAAAVAGLSAVLGLPEEAFETTESSARRGTKHAPSGSLPSRIDSRLKEIGLSARAASIAAGGGPDVLRDIKRAASRGRLGRLTPEIEAGLCRILNVTPDFFTDSGSPAPPPPDESSLGAHLARVDAILADAGGEAAADTTTSESRAELVRRLEEALDLYPPDEREMVVRLIVSGAPKRPE